MASSSSNGNVTRTFCEAALAGNLKLVKRLATQLVGGDGLATTIAGVKDGKGQTALHFAAAGGKTNVCKYLIEELKCDVNIKDGQGHVPLHRATLGDHFLTAAYLLEKGANPSAANDQRMTALHLAAGKGSTNLLCQLILKGALVDAVSDSGTPLQCTAIIGEKEAMRILLENNANPNEISNQIFPPLVLSILKDSLECVKLLVQSGADPNDGSAGASPLQVAASKGNTAVIKYLIKAGANPNVTNKYGLTPIEIAASNGNHQDVMVLFSVTSQIPCISDWSCGGIIKYLHSKEGRERRELNKREYFAQLKLNGEGAFKRNDYVNAICWYSEAINTDPTDAAMLSNRSLCYSRLKQGDNALLDAQACLTLRPDWPKAYYREGVAWNLLNQYRRAANSFLAGLKLDPETKELKTALRDALLRLKLT